MRSIRARVTAGALAVVALAFVLGGAGFVFVLDRTLTAGVEQSVETDLDQLAAQLEAGAVTAADLTDRDDDVLVALFVGGTVAVNDDDAQRLPSDTDGDPVRVVIDGEPWLAVSDDVDDLGVLTVARSLDEVATAVTTTAVLTAVAVPAALAVIGVVVWIVARRALAPVEAMRREVAGIDEQGLHRRVTGGGTELDALAGTMNGMLDRLEASQARQRRFVSDASHELRSPLATLRQHAELARAHPDAMPPGELADVVLGEGERMQHLVDALLLLARLDEGRAPARAAVDLDDLAYAELRRLRAVDGIEPVGDGVAPVRVTGDERLLGRAVRNLVDNAVRHAAGRVAVGVEQRGDRALVHVDDDGAGVPDDERERVFERFTRLDEARARDDGGSGLGLAIVREIAAAHGGTARAARSPWGGARFTIDLPVGAPDATGTAHPGTPGSGHEPARDRT